MKVKQIDVYGIEDRIRKTDKETWQYIKALKEALKRQQELTNLAIKKLRDNGRAEVDTTY